MVLMFPSLPPTEATDLLQKLSLDSQTKTLEVPEATKKKPSSIPYGSVDSGDVTNVPPIPSSERSTTPLLQDFMDPSMCYGYGPATYYYGGYDGQINEWEEYPRYVNPDGVEIPPGVYGDNGSIMYHHGYGYAPYGAYSPAGSPVPTIGHDGQLYGPHHYQYGAPYYQPPTPPSGPYTPNQTTGQGDVSTSVASDQVPLSVEPPKGNAGGVANGNTNSNGSAQLWPSYSNGSAIPNGPNGRGVVPGVTPVSGYQDPRFGFDGMRSPVPWLDGPVLSDGQPRPATSNSISSTVSHVSNVPAARNQNLRPLTHLMGLHPARPASGMGSAHGFMNRMYQNNRMFGSAVRTGPGFGSNGYDSRANGRGWLAVDSKYKPRGRGNGLFGYGHENMDGLNELNRGPRAGRFKNQKGFAPNITIAVKGQNLPSNEKNDESSVVPDRDQYNHADFSVNYSDAKFFVIKSYSEDDIHKSIKYSVWASTVGGNQKLNAAYQEAQGKSSDCPVNTSGQFVGVAEMMGPVDFNKSVEYWQQDKWTGCFAVKWHVVKDVPNSLLKHIKLENNEDKPVTNSRDTQEVKLDHGLEMLKIFKEHSSKTCILDDFLFYEARQKTMQEKKAKQLFQKQASFAFSDALLALPLIIIIIAAAAAAVWDGKQGNAASDEKAKEHTKVKVQSPLELSSPAQIKEGGQGPAEGKPSSEETELVPGAGDAPKGAKPALEKRTLANGTANGC
ncbi:hypothetical protein ACLOJK_005771 [Asimina triloba]